MVIMIVVKEDVTCEIIRNQECVGNMDLNIGTFVEIIEQCEDGLYIRPLIHDVHRRENCQTFMLEEYYLKEGYLYKLGGHLMETL